MISKSDDVRVATGGRENSYPSGTSVLTPEFSVARVA